MLTQDKVRELLHYTPNTGALIWRALHRHKWNGHEAGWLVNSGILRVTIDGVDYPAHSVVWLWMTEHYPLAGNIVHLDDDPTNLAWRNLRYVSLSQKAARHGLSCRNTSGYKGVSWSARSKAWRAAIKQDGKSYHLGLFTDPADAARAYDAEALARFGRYARLNVPSRVRDNLTMR